MKVNKKYIYEKKIKYLIMFTVLLINYVLYPLEYLMKNLNFALNYS